MSWTGKHMIHKDLACTAEEGIKRVSLSLISFVCVFTYSTCYDTINSVLQLQPGICYAGFDLFFKPLFVVLMERLAPVCLCQGTSPSLGSCVWSMLVSVLLLRCRLLHSLGFIGIHHFSLTGATSDL